MKSIRDVKYFTDEKTGCHIPKRQKGVWHEGSSGDNGYILLSFKDHRARAHRESYMHYKGVIPKDMVVMHSCDNRECINPNHLSLGTRKDNTQDMIKKGRDNQHVGRKRSKLNAQQIEEIRSSELSSYQLAKIYPVSSTHIRRIRNGTRANPNYKQKQYINPIKNTIEPKCIAVEIDY